MGNYDINLPAGTYHAKAISAGTYETTGGAFMLGVQWMLDNDAQNTIRSRICLVTKAGVVMERQIKRIREWAVGWNGISTEWFAEHFAEFDVDLVIERRVDQYDNTEKPEVAFINPAKSSTRGEFPAADQKALSEKYGAKLHAVTDNETPKMPPPRRSAAMPPKAETDVGDLDVPF